MPSRRSLTIEHANEIYDILMEHAGASEGGRDDFVFHQTTVHVEEYRFMGSLGSGGKFWRCNGRWYVSAYPEDLLAKPERHEIVSVTNAALDGLRASYVALAEALDEEPTQ